MKAKQLQRERIRAELERAGVDIQTLPGGALRLRGAFSNVILTSDLNALSAREIGRLTAPHAHARAGGDEKSSDRPPAKPPSSSFGQ